MPAVSVIVPVYDPGPNIDDCIRTLLDQSLPADAYEVIFVDDGSTDGTGARLDALAAAHPHVRAVHIANSGWPGRPRNIGLELARGDWVLFVDNDDWLEHEALERLWARAEADDADVVVGKVVGHGKGVPRQLFAANRSGLTLEDLELLRLLTPHKLFRKAFLDEHGIRFPEGRRRLEDHVFVVHAYCHARSISVLADHPCYHWMRRADRGNASLTRLDPPSYYRDVREVLDLVEAHVPPGALRDRLLVHWLRGKALRRVGGGSLLRRDEEARRLMVQEVRGLVLERYPPRFDRDLSFALRVRTSLVRDGSIYDLCALAGFERQLRARTTARVRSDEGRLVLDLEARLDGDKAPLRFGSTRWVPPPALRDRLPADRLEAGADLAASRIDLFVRSQADRAEYLLPAPVDVTAQPDGSIVLRATAILDATNAAAGGPLDAGGWQVNALVDIAGFQTAGPVRAVGYSERLVVDVDERGRVAQRPAPSSRPPRPPLSARVAGRARSLVRQARR